MIRVSVREVRSGDLVVVRGPIGRYFVWSPEQTEPVQLIAGGSGIVPLMAIIRAHRAVGSTAPFRLLHSVRTREMPCTPRRSPRRSMIDAEILSTEVIKATDSPQMYVCGPTGFVETVAGTLVAFGHEPGRIRTERFGGA